MKSHYYYFISSLRCRGFEIKRHQAQKYREGKYLLLLVLNNNNKVEFETQKGKEKCKFKQKITNQPLQGKGLFCRYFLPDFVYR